MIHSHFGNAAYQRLSRKSKAIVGQKNLISTFKYWSKKLPSNRCWVWIECIWKQRPGPLAEGRNNLQLDESVKKAEVRRSFITTTAREQHPRSQHKGATGRVRTSNWRPTVSSPMSLPTCTRHPCTIIAVIWSSTWSWETHFVMFMCVSVCLCLCKYVYVPSCPRYSSATYPQNICLYWKSIKLMYVWLIRNWAHSTHGTWKESDCPSDRRQ